MRALTTRRGRQSSLAGLRRKKKVVGRNRGGALPPKSSRNSGSAWSAADLTRLAKLIRGNTPTRVVALKLGRTPGAIYRKAAQQGLSLRPPNQRPYGRWGR